MRAFAARAHVCAGGMPTKISRFAGTRLIGHITRTILPHPRSPGGKPQRLTARVKIASARPYFPQPRFAGGANFRFVCLSVCPSVRGPVRRSKFGRKSGARCSFERGNPNFSTGRRGFDVTATLLALLRHKSRRRRAPRPAAGPPTHAIAGTRARAVTMATDRPPSLLNHSRRLASCRAPRHCRLSTPPSRFAFPSGGAPTGASLHLDRLPLQRRRPRRRVCGLRRLRPALPASSPMCAETCNWASDADCDDGGPGSGSARPGPTACGTGPSSHVRCV